MTLKYRIYPLPIVKLLLDKGTFTYLNFYGEKIWAPTYSFYIEGADQNILVDTAISAEDWNKHRTIPAQDIVTFEESLANFGLTPDDIDIVLATHLHLDHFFNARKCRNAKIIVQEEELRFVLHPRPPFAQHYSRELLEGFNFETVKGDREIIPGIDVILTPGHTAGNQSVAIDTEEGIVVIPGFCSLEENFNQKDYIVPGINFDPFQAYESIVRVQEIGERVIPLHSQRLVKENIKCIP